MKAAIVVLLIAIVVQTFATSTGLLTFYADFNVTASVYNHGFFNGQIYYDWTQYAFLLTFPVADEYSELYIFNNGNGYNENLLNGQFSSQYLYKNSSHCLCETTSLVSSMPLFFLDDGAETYNSPPVWIPDTSASATTLTYEGKTCTGYVVNPNSSPDDQLVTYFWQTAAAIPCGFVFADGRTFTFSNVAQTKIPATRFIPPVDCKCGKPIDVVVSLDRTGSILVWEWYIQHNFTQNLVQAFDFGPLKTNMGIVDWNSEFWTTLDLSTGVSADTVNTAVAAMGCCEPITSIYQSCCCCGTPIGGGLYYAAQMMLTSTRSSATKVIILLTDGCQNHIYDQSTNPPSVTACDCATEQSCQTDTACINDIQTHYQEVTAAIPGIKIIAVGVGTDQTICELQLEYVAGSIMENIFRPQSWQDLSTLVQSISSTACDVDDSTCVGCCGICSCGSCIKPTDCVPPDMCSTAVVSAASNCCSIAPLTCPPKPCFSVQCNPQKGCVYTPLPCPPSTNCTAWSCNANATLAVDQICTLRVTCSAAPQCVVNADCNDNNKCTNDACIKGNCSWTPAVCGESNNCTTFSCDPLLGCSNTSIVCNDFNLCTKDSCVGNVKGGCVFTPIVCNKSRDACYYASCSPAVGCYNQMVKCNISTTNCTVVACVNGTCGRQNVCLPPPPPAGSETNEVAIVGGALGVAALVGIILGVIALIAGLGGAGAAAFASGGAGGGATVIANNPLYKDTGMGGQSPLYKAGV